MGEDSKTIQKNTEIENLIIFNEKNKYELVDSLSMAMENQLLLDIRSVVDSGLVTEILSQDSPASSESFNLQTAVINNPTEDGLLSIQDNHLCTINVGETLLDHFKYPLTIENQNAVVEVEVPPLGNDSCDDEDLEKYKELNLPEEAEHMHSPYLPSNCVHFLSSVAMQHKNCSVLTSSIFSPEGTVDQNVRMIPVFRSFIPPVAESSSDICGLPQTSASVYDEIAEVREAVSNVIENHQDRAVFQSSNVDESGCKLLTLHSVPEESRCSQRNDSKPVVICQLEGGTQILCINSCDTQELKPVHLIPEYQNQHNYLQSVVHFDGHAKTKSLILGTMQAQILLLLSIGAECERLSADAPDVDNPVTAVLGQFLPIPGELVLNEQEFENGPLQPVVNTATFHLESHLHGPVEITSDGSFLNKRQMQPQCESLPFGSGVTKSKKPCNCTKSQCLKLYCDCFANGDFCNNCNCNNCYNNQLHESERFKAVKVCLDRNPEAFLPKIGKRKLGEIKPHHNKGCNCKRSGCLKNYCECFEAKILCSSICKCIGCKNYEESPDENNQFNVLNYKDIGNNEGKSPVLSSTFKTLPKLKKDRQPAVCISWEEVKAVCACLLLQAEEAEKRGYSVRLAERMIMEEFERCLSQILHA